LIRRPGDSSRTGPYLPTKLAVSIREDDVRELCTTAVFERGTNYREEGRIRRLDRIGSSITATVQGSRRYELALDLEAERFDLEENFDRVDAAYDHYAQTFTAALEGYVECVAESDRDQERSRAVEFLSRRATSGVDYLREHYERALAHLDATETEG